MVEGLLNHYTWSVKILVLEGLWDITQSQISPSTFLAMIGREQTIKIMFTRKKTTMSPFTLLVDINIDDTIATMINPIFAWIALTTTYQ